MVEKSCMNCGTSGCDYKDTRKCASSGSNSLWTPDEKVKLTAHESLKAVIQSQLKELGNEYRQIVNDDKDILVIRYADGEYYQLGYVAFYSVFYGEYTLYEGEHGYMVTGLQYFPLNMLDQAIAAFEERLGSSTPSKEIKGSFSLEEIKAMNASTEEV